MKQQTEYSITKENTKIESLDGPPLDFSFKNIRSLQELQDSINSKQAEQKLMNQTTNLGATRQEGQYFVNKPVPKTNSNLNTPIEGEKEVQEVEPKLQIIRTIETNEYNYQESQHRKIANKNEKIEKKVKKIVCPQTTAIFLRYNKLNSIDNFCELVEPVFPNLTSTLMWIDLSHNRLTSLTTDLGQIKSLKTLYLHANFISDFNELEKVKNAQLLRTLTIHANPLEEYPEFRIVIHGILQNLKKIDSTLLTKRETDRASILMKGLKKYPQVKKCSKLPGDSSNEEDD